MDKILKDKICLVTCATSGIGLETACGLANFGANVIIAGRSEDIGNQVIEDIKARTGNGFIELIAADFALQSEVRDLAKTIRKRYDQLDVLVNNAELFQPELEITEDGVELTFAVNYLAPFLLTHKLLGLLRKGQPSRVVNVSSSFHKGGYINFKDINMYKNYNEMQAYKNSKLALILFTNYLAKEVERLGITVNSLHSGISETNLPRGKSLDTFLLKMQSLFTTPKKSAETPIYVTSSPEIVNVTGEYFVKKKIAKTKYITRNEGLQEKLWELSKELTKIKKYV